jgi:hypothetical protein
MGNVPLERGHIGVEHDNGDVRTRARGRPEVFSWEADLKVLKRDWRYGESSG